MNIKGLEKFEIYGRLSKYGFGIVRGKTLNKYNNFGRMVIFMAAIIPKNKMGYDLHNLSALLILDKMGNYIGMMYALKMLSLSLGLERIYLTTVPTE